MCGTAYFVEHVESETFGTTGGSGGPERKKSARAQRESLFSGRTHAGSLFYTYFVGLDIFSPPESVLHN